MAVVKRAKKVSSLQSISIPLSQHSSLQKEGLEKMLREDAENQHIGRTCRT